MVQGCTSTLISIGRMGLSLMRAVSRIVAQAPMQPMAGLPSLTSSELDTQTLAAQADVLVAAKAWPVLTKSLADLTDVPGRQQLAIGLRAAIPRAPQNAGPARISTWGGHLRFLQEHAPAGSCDCLHRGCAPRSALVPWGSKNCNLNFNSAFPTIKNHFVE